MKKIHNIEGDLETVMRNITNNPNLSESTKAILFDFQKHIEASQVSTSTVCNYMCNSYVLARNNLCDFSKMKKSDVRVILQFINGMDNCQNTKYKYQIALKRLLEFTARKKQMKLVAPVRTKSKQKMPEEILEESEVINLILSSKTSNENDFEKYRDMAFLSSLYEGGFRVGEIGMWKLMAYHDVAVGAVLPVDGKTGVRWVRLIVSKMYLSAYLRLHPFAGQSEAPLWVDRTGRQLMYGDFVKIVRKAKAAVGLQKKIHCHLFRHSRCTHVAAVMTESQMRDFFGWSKRSPMAATYVHLCMRNIDMTMFKIHGIPIPEENIMNYTIRECDKCKKMIPKFDGECLFCKNV
ncbi:tyrosine-type recombinase/integrase [Methanolapillus millepedarum]|uniref:Tyrosine recombinase XerC n=1 Tax=Methanolapillus millepedarum TaxID=3028296 RepID=A0AA96V5F0_9EURY|nr:Tyrosine recombinase XerC [Methanosarcinaceae archaeon Ac7]